MISEQELIYRLIISNTFLPCWTMICMLMPQFCLTDPYNKIKSKYVLFLSYVSFYSDLSCAFHWGEKLPFLSAYDIMCAHKCTLTVSYWKLERSESVGITSTWPYLMWKSVFMNEVEKMNRDNSSFHSPLAGFLRIDRECWGDFVFRMFGVIFPILVNICYLPRNNARL